MESYASACVVLRFSGGDISKGVLKSVSKLVGIQQLYLQDTSMDDKKLQLVCKHLTTLRTLDLSRTLVTSHGFKGISSLKSLDCLVLNGCARLTDASFSLIFSVSSLKRLHMDYLHDITDAAFFSFYPISLHLEELFLRRCTKLSDKVMAYVTRMKSIRKLDLSFCCGMSNDMFTSLRSLVRLEELYLDSATCTSVFDAQLEQIAAVSTLQVLDLSHSSIKGECFSKIASMLSVLKVLVLRGCVEISRTGFVQISMLTSLTTLDLSRTLVTENSLNYLVDVLPSIKRITVIDCFELVTGEMNYIWNEESEVEVIFK